jgi:LysM repeat protein
MGSPWKSSRNLIFALLASLCLVFCGCGKSPSRGDRGERIFHRGQAFMKEGKCDAALRCFLNTTRQNSKYAAEAHLECGEIYLASRRDPLSAIYHYREYLRKSSPNRQTALVRQRIATAEKAYLEQIPVLKQLGRENHGDMLRTLKAMQDENAKLKRQVTVLLQKLNEIHEVAPVGGGGQLAETAAAEKSIAAAANGVRHYTVQNGDTLSSISLKTYGTAARWREIFDANRDQLRSPAQLKVGYVLAIP